MQLETYTNAILFHWTGIDFEPKRNMCIAAMLLTEPILSPHYKHTYKDIAIGGEI